MLNKIRETRAFTLMEVMIVVVMMAAFMLFILGIRTVILDIRTADKNFKNRMQITEQVPQTEPPQVTEKGDLNRL